MKDVIQKLVDMLEEAENHLSYCGYGDSWERECAEASRLEERIHEAISLGLKALGDD